MTGNAGLDPGRVAQLRVQGPGGPSRGSGYRLNSTAVLTAAHVVAEARTIHVVFNADLPDEWTAAATVALCEPAVDVAVLRIDPPSTRSAAEMVWFGKVGRAAAVLRCRAVGFPLFKMRADEASAGTGTTYRDVHQADGMISSLSNWREGTLEITVPVPPDDPYPEHSPWEGMSGAAVWCGDRIIGVISKHHRNDGLNRLAAVRTDRWYQKLTADRLLALRELIGLPAEESQLADVIQPDQNQFAAAAYVEQVEDIAPMALHGRDAELAVLTDFCAGDEFYQWWQAGPWAGKTALTSWFVLHPPAGVAVISFFVTGRLAGQADSSAFTEALIPQLAAAAGLTETDLNNVPGRDGQRLLLIKRAAARAAADGRRLLLLVDGLDEDQGVPPIGPSSIAALLPRRPLEGLRVIVTSRPYPGLPHDVAPDHPLRQFRDDHPLRAMRPRRLKHSELGEELKVLAKAELIEHLHGTDQLVRSIIGYIAAAGGGLTIGELGELTAATYAGLGARLGSVFGRSLRQRTDSYMRAERMERVYLFAHETLREIADEQLGYDLDRYRERIFEWADSYERQAWPEGTPRYLWRPYSRMLADIHDVDRLVRLSTAPRRHDQMLVVMLTDAAALAEIIDARQAVLDSPVPDLGAIALIAVEADRLSLRNNALPSLLPAIWVALDEADRAEQLARSMTDSARQSVAMVRVAEALVAAGLADRAERLARTIIDPFWQARALAPVARALTASGDIQRAVRLANTLPDPYGQMEVLTQVAEALVAARRIDDAEQLARSVSDRYVAARLLGQVATAMVMSGDVDLAEQLAHSVQPADVQEEVLAQLGKTLAEARHLDRAGEIAQGLSDRAGQAEVLAQLAEAFALSGLPDRAEQLARSIAEPSWNARALAMVARAHAATPGLTDRAERLAYTIPDGHEQLSALIEVATATAMSGQSDSAERLACSIPDLYARTSAQARVAEALAIGGQFDRAEDLARSIADPDRQTRALVVVAATLATARQFKRAELLAGSIIDTDQQMEALGAIAACLAADGQVAPARQIASAVERMARSVTVSDADPRVLHRVAEALMAIEDFDRAERVARVMSLSRQSAEQLAIVAEALVAAGQVDRAEQVARSVTHPYERDAALARVGVAQRQAQTQALMRAAEEFAAAGQFDRVENLARRTTWTYERDPVLARVAAVLIAAGQFDRAEHVARLFDRWQEPLSVTVAVDFVEVGQFDRAENLARDMIEPYHQDALAQVAEALTKAGEFKRAEQLARSIPNTDGQVDALAGIAAALAADGQVAQARKIAAAVERMARVTVSDADPKSHNVGEALIDEFDRYEHPFASAAPDWRRRWRAVAEALVAVGKSDRAENLARNLTEPSERELALARVAEALAAVGQSDRAENLARNLTEPYEREQALARVAEALAAAGHFEQAEQVAQRISRHDLQSETLAHVTTSLTAAGDLDYAEQVAGRITSPSRRAAAFVQITEALAAAGEFDHAEQLVGQIVTDPSRLDDALVLLAETLATSRDPDRAERLVGRINDADRHVAATVQLAETLVASGDPDRAERLVGRINDADRRGSALVQVAEALTKLPADPSHARARAIVARVLASNSWYQAIPILATLAPGAVVSVADAILVPRQETSTS
jgi:lipopolysaccharide biosynthesis regulator YciM